MFFVPNELKTKLLQVYLLIAQFGSTQPRAIFEPANVVVSAGVFPLKCGSRRCRQIFYNRISHGLGHWVRIFKLTQRSLGGRKP
jgi:hypothetical protein